MKRVTKRTEQVGSLIAQVVSEIIRTEISDPKVAGIVSITAVRVSSDLKNATVYFSILGKINDWETVEIGLNRASGYIQRLMAQRIVLKVTPKITFAPDHTMEKAQEIEKLIEEQISHSIG